MLDTQCPMTRFDRSLSVTALFTLLAIVLSAAAPVAVTAPAFAQTTFDVTPPPPEISLRIPSGTILPVKYLDAEKILVAPNEPAPVPLTLTMRRNIVSSDRTLLIPVDSKVVGELVTVESEGGAQFIAKQLILPDGREILIRATSQMVTKKEAVSKNRRSLGGVIKNAALGAAAAAAITVLSGGTAIAPVLLGAGAGASTNLLGLFNNRDRVELISIKPDLDLNLTLNADLAVRPFGFTYPVP